MKIIMLNDLVTVLIFLNVFLSIIIIIWNLYAYQRIQETERWTKLLYTFTGVVWFIRYNLYLFDMYPFDKENVNPYILIIMTYTLLSLAVGSIIRVGRLFTKKEILNDLREWMCGREKWT